MQETPQSFVERLVGAGLSEAKIADELVTRGVQVTQATINRIKKGAGTSYEIGVTLQRLADERAPRSTCDA